MWLIINFAAMVILQSMRLELTMHLSKFSLYPNQKQLLSTSLMAGLVLLFAGCTSNNSVNPELDIPTRTGTDGTENLGNPLAAENAETAEWIAAIAPDQELAAMVPETVRADGVLQVATDLAAPPNEFLGNDSTTVAGWEIELTQAIAAKLGLRSDFYAVEFNSIPTNLQAGHYEVGVAAFTDNNTERGEMDYVTLYQGAAAIAVAADSSVEINPSDLSTLCGQRIGIVQTIASPEQDLTAINQQCQQNGQPEVDVAQQGGLDEITTAVTEGELDILLAESPVIGYVVRQSNGNLENLGRVAPVAPYGMAIPEGGGQMNEAVMGALQALISEGVYQQILDRWGIADAALMADEVDELGSLDPEG
jgi:polar amino acid transport system substrate-binding protein